MEVYREKVLIWDKGEKKGQVLVESKYLPDYQIIRIPLPPDVSKMVIRMSGEPPEPTPMKYAECKHSGLNIKGKEVYLCEEKD